MTRDDPERHAHRVFEELERYIRRVNAEEISEVTGGITLDSLRRAASYVSKLRARYLREVLDLAKCEDAEEACDVPQLRQLRQAYEEARLGFDALKHALERGYFEMHTDGRDRGRLAG